MRYLGVALAATLAIAGLLACNDDEPELDGGADADADGDGDGDGDGDADADADLPDWVHDADTDWLPSGLTDCSDDVNGCPSGYECQCGGPGPGPWPCNCGLECDMANGNADCTEPLQPICCYGVCTDPCTCMCQ